MVSPNCQNGDYLHYLYVCCLGDKRKCHGYHDKVFTITSDNGKEFADHQRISKQLTAKVYFAHPYHSWERGLNENTNGLIRQYFPKNTNFRSITVESVRKVMEQLNNRPRKTLDYATPNEVFFGKHWKHAA